MTLRKRFLGDGTLEDDNKGLMDEHMEVGAIKELKKIPVNKDTTCPTMCWYVLSRLRPCPRVGRVSTLRIPPETSR